MLGVGGRANTSLYDATRVFVSKAFGGVPSSKAEGTGGRSDASNPTKSSSGLIHQDVLPELMRLQKYVER